MNDTSTISNHIQEPEIQQLLKALKDRQQDGTSILGSQLGDLVRRHLADPDLKRRFGGLKPFVLRYFPNNIRWEGRKGLDDVYRVAFEGGLTSNTTNGGWQPVPRESSPWFWPAVSNPSIDIQFAWSTQKHTLLHAAPGVALEEGLVTVAKLGQEDYRTMATTFIQTMRTSAPTTYLQALENATSIGPFTTLLRREGTLADWEVFRIDHVLRTFAERLETAGSTKEVANEWTDMLRSSQQLARTQRMQRTDRTARIQELTTQTNCQHDQENVPTARDVASRTIGFLSDAEIAELKLPLGSVMSALRSLLKTE